MTDTDTDADTETVETAFPFEETREQQARRESESEEIRRHRKNMREMLSKESDPFRLQLWDLVMSIRDTQDEQARAIAKHSEQLNSGKEQFAAIDGRLDKIEKETRGLPTRNKIFWTLLGTAIGGVLTAFYFFLQALAAFVEKQAI